MKERIGAERKVWETKHKSELEKEGVPKDIQEQQQTMYVIGKIITKYLVPVAAVGIGAYALTRKRGGIRRKKYTRRSKYRSG